MKSSLSQDLGQRLFHVRVLVPPYTNLQDSVELFSCPPISKIPETCPPEKWPMLCTRHPLLSDACSVSEASVCTQIFHERRLSLSATLQLPRFFPILVREPRLWFHSGPEDTNTPAPRHRPRHAGAVFRSCVTAETLGVYRAHCVSSVCL